MLKGFNLILQRKGSEKVCQLAGSSIKPNLVPMCRLDCQGRVEKQGNFIFYTQTHARTHTKPFSLQNIYNPFNPILNGLNINFTLAIDSRGLKLLCFAFATYYGHT